MELYPLKEELNGGRDDLSKLTCWLVTMFFFLVHNLPRVISNFRCLDGWLKRAVNSNTHIKAV